MKSVNLLRAMSWCLISLLIFFTGFALGVPGKQCGDGNGGANVSCTANDACYDFVSNGINYSQKYTKTTIFYKCTAGGDLCAEDDYGVKCEYDWWAGFGCQGNPSGHITLNMKSCK